MDGQRMSVTDEQVIAYLTDLHKSVDGVPAHFVFNIDQMGHQDAADAKPRKCVVQVIFMKEISITQCLAKGRESALPLM
jgi:hypothetical protein